MQVYYTICFPRTDKFEEIPSFSSSLLPAIVDNEIDGVHASRDDHQEGIWEH